MNKLISNLSLYVITLQSAYLDRQLDLLNCKARQLEPCPNETSLFISDELEDVGKFIRFRDATMESIATNRAYEFHHSSIWQLINLQTRVIRKVKKLDSLI